MSDRFLEDHCMAAHAYRLCGPLSPASIRDMTIRAEELVNRLLRTGKINDSSRVLIVGAGVSGTCCAATLLTQSNCAVTLNDLRPSPLSVQTGVRHRHVAPHGFDWPYYFYRLAHHPLAGKSVMPWRASAADEVAKQFNMRFAKLAAGRGRGRLWNAMNNPVVDWTYSPAHGWDVRFARPPVPGQPVGQHYDLLLLCCGVSAEADQICGYRGYRFWDPNDCFLSTRTRPLTKNDTVLICGGGDGGLNDFVRLVTAFDARRLASQARERDRPRCQGTLSSNPGAGAPALSAERRFATRPTHSRLLV